MYYAIQNQTTGHFLVRMNDLFFSPVDARLYEKRENAEIALDDYGKKMEHFKAGDYSVFSYAGAKRMNDIYLDSMQVVEVEVSVKVKEVE